MSVDTLAQAPVMLAFARCCGFFSRAPAFGHPSVPAHVRVVCAIAVTLMIAPALPAGPPFDVPSFLLALAAETALGAAIGTFAAIVYDGAYAGGRLVDDYAGVRAIAPSIALVAPSGFGRIWSLVFTGGMLLSGAYAPMILAWAESFHVLPPGGALLISRDALYAYALQLPAAIVLVGVSIAGPAIAIAFVVHIVLALLARTIPRFSTFPLATACVFASALTATMFSIPTLEHIAEHPFVHTPLLSVQR